jgi:periplasmic copper chaperone A
MPSSTRRCALRVGTVLVAAPPADAAAPVADTTARWLGGSGLLVGALGLGVGAGAVLRSRRTAGVAR